MRENGRNVSERRLGRGKVSESKVNGAKVSRRKVSGRWDRCDKVTWISWDDGFL